MEEERKSLNNGIPRQSKEINLGSFLPYHILNKLKLFDLSNAIDMSSKRQFSHYDVLEFLTLTRIIYPSSKIDTYLNQLQTRPIYVSTMDSILGHFFTCYLALTLIRLIQKKELDNKFNAETIIDFIKTLKAFPVSNEQFLLSGSTQDFIKEIEKRYHLSFNSKTISFDKFQKLFSF